MSEDEPKELPRHSVGDELDSIDDEFEKLKKQVIDSVDPKSSHIRSDDDNKISDLEGEIHSIKKQIEDIRNPVKKPEIVHQKELELNKNDDAIKKLDILIRLKSASSELDEKKKDKDLARIVYVGKITFSGVATLAVMAAGLVLHSQKDPLGSLLLGAGATKAGLTIVEKKKDKKDD
jgi:hypothetical protein